MRYSEVRGDQGDFHEKLACSSHHMSMETELRHAVEALRPGDTLFVPDLASLRLPLKNMLSFFVQLSAKGIYLRAVREGIDTREFIRPADLCRYLLEAQDQLRRGRIKTGMVAARSRGAAVGRPRVLQVDDILAFKELSESPGMTIRKAANSLGINVSTVRKRARALGINLRPEHTTASVAEKTAFSKAATRAKAKEEKIPQTPGRPAVFRPEDVIAFRQLVESGGMSIRQAAVRLGFSETTLHRHARRLGIRLRQRAYNVPPLQDGRADESFPKAGSRLRAKPRKMHAEVVQQFREMIERGHPIADVAIALGVSERTLRMYARPHGILVPRRRIKSRPAS